MFEPFAHIPNASLLRQAGHGTARLLIYRIMTIRQRVYVGAVLSTLVVGVGGNALFVQKGRHPAPLYVPPNQHASPASPSTASIVTPVVPDAPPAPAATDASPVSSTPASAPLPPPSLGHGERRSAARMPDQIGDLLRGKSVADESRLIRAAQSALAKLGYPVKADRAEDHATRQALRDLERAHGLALNVEVSSQLVSQLTAAVKAGHKGQHFALTTASSQ